MTNWVRAFLKKIAANRIGDGHHCELISRRGHVYKFHQLAGELDAVPADEAILDGEIVCLVARLG